MDVLRGQITESSRRNSEFLNSFNLGPMPNREKSRRRRSSSIKAWLGCSQAQRLGVVSSKVLPSRALCIRRLSWWTILATVGVVPERLGYPDAFQPQTDVATACTHVYTPHERCFLLTLTPSASWPSGRGMRLYSRQRYPVMAGGGHKSRTGRRAPATSAMIARMYLWCTR